MNKSKSWYENDYATFGLAAQRRYPNEELLRFLGRNYFGSTYKEERSHIKVLEMGCGSGANLWMLAKEGFDTYGIDISKKALELAKQFLERWNVNAKLKQGSFTDLPFNCNSFDCVIDVFSMYCLNDKEFNIALDESVRVLNEGGKFFSYTPGVESDAFKNYSPSKKIDEFTLNGIYRETSPFAGNHYPFHFISPQRYNKLLEDRNMHVEYLETVERSYRNGTEKFQHVVITGVKTK